MGYLKSCLLEKMTQFGRDFLKSILLPVYLMHEKMGGKNGNGNVSATRKGMSQSALSHKGTFSMNRNKMFSNTVRNTLFFIS